MTFYARVLIGGCRVVWHSIGRSTDAQRHETDKWRAAPKIFWQKFFILIIEDA